jgi:hypothetical protein
MPHLIRLLALAIAGVTPLFMPGLATGQPAKTDPAKGALFINMTTRDPWRG